MPDLLQSKLHLPGLRRAVLDRSRLLDRMGSAREARLTLVSAPAGFGKTTLLSQWCASSPAVRRSTAWVSLDGRDDDPVSFWAYVLAALQTVVPDLRPTGPVPLPAAQAGAGLEPLLNDLQSLEQDVHLVLDDYHVITDQQVHAGVGFLLEHLPPQLHVVLATRADPPLQLSRLRARGQLVEVRAADLRFTPQEAAAYLGDGMGLALSEQDVLALDGRTEGWAAALQLAALSMQGRDDPSAFIAGFTGDDRYVVDYLAEEVLQRLPDDVRRFLLHTCVLDRFTGALCDAVTAGSGGSAVLEALERQNVFVVPLDHARRWYRYHHLFADVLRARLLDEQPGLVPTLHLRASTWHEQQGDLPEAVHHAMAGGHTARAAGLVEQAVPALRRDRQEATLRRWIEALPGRLVRDSALLSIAHVGTLMAHGDVEGADPPLHDAERLLAEGGDDPRLRTLPGTIAMYRAGQARLRGDVDGTVRHARTALGLAGPDDHLERGAAAALLGLAHWTTGDVVSAAQCYTDAVAAMHRAGHVADALGCTLALADLELSRGRLGEAVAACTRALTAAQREPGAPRGTADMHTALAALLLERDEVDAAAEHLRTGAALGDGAALPQNAYRWRVTTAHLHQRRGDAAGALALLDEAERRYDTDYSPDVRPIAALRARLWLAEGRTDEAAAYARTRGLSVDDEVSSLREYEHLTLVRVLLQQVEQGRRPGPDPGPLLRRLLAAAQEGGRTGSALDVLLLQARLAHARSDPRAAQERLDRALALAEPQGLVRSLTEHGPVLAALLRTSAARHEPYVRRLLGAVEPQPSPRGTGPDRLSEREAEVLRLLASDLDGPDIARTLVVSVNTVRTHTKSIYAKLGVTSRRAAVHRAQDLGLLVRR